MPIYEYHCRQCDRPVEVWLRSGADQPLCPECGSALQDKLLTAPHMMSAEASRPAGLTCCGREERCDSPGCSTEQGCQRG